MKFHATNPEQARQAIEKIKRLGRWARAQALDATSTNPTAEEAFNTAYHAQLEYTGERLHVKVPRIPGHLVMNTVRPLVERLSGRRVTKRSTAQETLEHEEAMYEQLQSAGVPSLISRRDVREALGVTGVLITNYAHLDDARPLIANHPATRIALGLRLAQTHDAGVYWADANPKNVKQDAHGLILIDFQHQYETTLPGSERGAHDLAEIATHAGVLAQNPQAALDVLKGYRNRRELPEEILSLVRRQRTTPRLYQRLRNNSIFGEHTGIIDETLRSIQRYAR